VTQELVNVSTASVPATITSARLPVLVERAGGAARFAWDEFFSAEHHHVHTQKAYLRAVRKFLVARLRLGDLQQVSTLLFVLCFLGSGCSSESPIPPAWGKAELSETAIESKIKEGAKEKGAGVINSGWISRLLRKRLRDLFLDLIPAHSPGDDLAVGANEHEGRDRADAERGGSRVVDAAAEERV
jgi:hypothetical protein